MPGVCPERADVAKKSLKMAVRRRKQRRKYAHAPELRCSMIAFQQPVGGPIAAVGSRRQRESAHQTYS